MHVIGVICDIWVEKRKIRDSGQIGRRYMSMRWERPRVRVQNFVTNEYVSACYSLYCMVAGDGTKFTGNQYFNTAVEWAGQTVQPDHKFHGQPCADGSSYDEDTKTFYENHKQSVISGIILSDDNDGNPSTYNAIWYSDDVNGTGRYTHYGRAVMDSRPNHS